MLQTIIKLILAVLFFLCLFRLPYGYYQAIRFAGIIGFAILAFYSYGQNNKIMVIVYIALALLFQPIVKVALGRNIWVIIDLIVSAGLIISLFVIPKNNGGL